MSQLIDLLLHADTYLFDIVANYGPWIYGVLFVIVFCETGLIVTPFLPGDSLLFAAGALAATGSLDIRLAAVLLIVAAAAGDAVNYAVGRSLGHIVIARAHSDPRWGRWIKPAYLAQAHEFFERYGGRAVILGRFMPIVRTFVPFVAGAAEMTYTSFAINNVIGAIAWVAICLGAGYAFGNVPFVKKNFEIVALGIVFVSLLPMFIEIIRQRARRSPL